MLWQEIREKYPSKWLVIEAKKFHQADDKFVVEDLEVLDIFDKSFDANTEMPILEIPTSRWMGFRELMP